MLQLVQLLVLRYLPCCRLQDTAARQRELAAQYHRINSAKVQLRRQRIGSKKEKAEEQRRLELLKKEAIAERNLQRRQEVSKLQIAYQWVGG